MFDIVFGFFYIFFGWLEWFFGYVWFFLIVCFFFCWWCEEVFVVDVVGGKVYVYIVSIGRLVIIIFVIFVVVEFG